MRMHSQATWLALVLVPALVLSLGAGEEARAAVAVPDVGVFIDGSPLHLTEPPVIQAGRTLVPMRGLFEALDADVQWMEATRTAVGTRDGVEVRIPIGSRQPTVNGTTVPIDVEAQIFGGRTYIPLRFVGEALGDQVDWDGANRRIDISRTAEAPGAPQADDEVPADGALALEASEADQPEAHFYGADGQLYHGFRGRVIHYQREPGQFSPTARPLANARILVGSGFDYELVPGNQLFYESLVPGTREFRTDSNGEFEVFIPEGTHDVFISKPGYVPASGRGLQFVVPPDHPWHGQPVRFELADVSLGEGTRPEHRQQLSLVPRGDTSSPGDVIF